NMLITPEAALKFTKTSVYLVCSWPLSVAASKRDQILMKIRWWIVLIFLLFLLLPLLNGIYSYHHDTLIMVKAICMSSACGQAILKIITCRKQTSRFQILLQEIEDFMKNANLREKEYLKKYINRAAFFHIFVTISIWLVCFDFIIEPIILGQKFPTDVAYPFSIDNQYLHISLYLHQVISLFFIAAALSIDFQVAILLWFTALKLETLGYYFENVSNEKELRYCIRKHQHMLWYANQVKNAVKYVALSTVLTTTIGIVCGCLTLISHQPLSVKLRVGNIVINAAVELFIYAWPANNLIQMSQIISSNVYHCNWYGKSTKMMKTVSYVIQRSQKPITIYISGFIPDISLQYYTSFLSTTFSYFTTMRILLSKE
ncbi:odorant receptor 22c-like, partial [Chelonus insularis]|uniref:odorant receptor 22c-like n=1 Tax=Chelonus insularis TaxID=460826 RepID=UPI00158A85ED